MGNMNQKNRPTPPITPEILTPRLGDYLVEKGLISSIQLAEALAIQKNQKESSDASKNALIGEILVSLNYLDKQSLDRAVTEMIVRLKKALERSNTLLEERVKERTQELEYALEKIKLLNAHKAEFVANISHELRTPLTHIMGYNYLLLDGTFGHLSEEQLDAVLSMKSATDRLEQLITDLISFTEIEHGKFQLNPRPVNPNEICEQAIKSNQDQANKKKVHIILQKKEDISPISVDAEKIIWVMNHLIDNAIKFTATAGYVLVKTSQNMNHVYFSVSDTGIGIPKERISEIFEPFHQLDGSMTRNAGGTGIGLTIAKEIIEAHQSEIKVYSQPGKGTEIKFAFPILKEAV
jgi:signal transduction histidine kinase